MKNMRKYWIVLAVGVCVLLDRYIGMIDGLEDGSYQAIAGWIGGVVSGVSSLAGGVFGSIAANRRLKKANKMIDDKQRRLDAWRNAEMNTDFLDRADSRAALRRVNEYNKEAQKADDTNGIKRGLTDEAKVAKAARLNRGYADTVSQVAGVGAQHKDRVQQQYMSETGALENIKIQNQMDTSGAESLAAGVVGAGNALGETLNTLSDTSKRRGIGDHFTKVDNMAKNAEGVPDLFANSRYQIKTK